LVLVDFDKCIGCKYCAWACPYGARELDEARKEMTKCTLCVDRIHDENLSERDRQPACVLACPTSARLFGDIHDPESVVSKAIEERGGYQLMPEWNTRPANHYLPRITTPASGCGSGSCSCKDTGAALEAPESHESLESRLERGELHLASMATRI
ncbi:4Fe-4S binding protein, partial [Klebsiella pneumoniae]|nr:4Fe-4S binding protein [Klebsiella pneumoniae]